METATVDDRKRVRIPETKPGQVYAVEQSGEGQFVLTLVKKADVEEPFPPGSLAKEVDAWNKEWAGASKKLKVPAVPKDWD